MTEVKKQNREQHIRKINERTSQTFKKNMLFLGESAPDLQREYSKYQPDRLRLSVSEEGYLNIKDIGAGGREIFPCPPDEYYRSLVNKTLSMPQKRKIDIRPNSKVLVDQQPHTEHYSNIANHLIENVPINAEEKLPRQVDLMIVLGVGLGQHIELLLSERDIKNLIIIEPNKDWFHASLHTAKWDAISDYFSRPGYSLNLQVGQRVDTAREAVRKHIENIGHHNAATLYFITHVESEENQSTIKDFVERLSQITTPRGFFDDERTGLAHTAKNFTNKIPVLTKHFLLHGKKVGIPAFVIGNGPSLDDAIDFLKSNQKNAILISCGTTLGSLQKAGLKPDIHIEQERPRMIREWLELSTSKKFREGIHLIALNTVHPEVFSLFENKALFMKPNDLGTIYSQLIVKPGKRIIQLPYCNPTVTNAGVSLATAIGFNEVYLFGVDYGYISKNDHHSKLSTYYQIKKDVFNGSQSAPENHETIEGNFGHRVTTTETLLKSKHSTEESIRAASGIRFFNTSKGARILGADPTRLSDISLNSLPDNKQVIIRRIVEANFENNVLASPGSKKSLSGVLSLARSKLTEILELLENAPNSVEEAQAQINTIQIILNSVTEETQESKATKHLIKGSINSYNLALKVCTERNKDPKISLDAYNYASGEYRKFLRKARKQIDGNFLAADNRLANLQGKLEKGD